jgi:phosphatidylglycerophosphate synthase
VIELALITAPSRASDLIFGRPLLERLLIVCERGGIRRFVIETPSFARESTQHALGRFRDRREVGLVDSLAEGIAGCDPAAACLRLSGNLVLAQSQLNRALAQYTNGSGEPLRIMTADSEHGGAIVVGALRQLLAHGTGSASQRLAAIATGALPFALNGRPEDREEAEVRLARSIREESTTTDALMARVFDRKLSWRLSLPLARLRIAPNAVTLSNTLLGFGCAVMLASTSYWIRLIGALLFLLSITIDGVDGELARLRMVESKFGGQLDVLTDNLVHIAIFVGLMAGCYRSSRSASYIYLAATLLLGFGFCAIAVNRALSVAGPAAASWISKVERATGRDFAYIVATLAIINRLWWFAWAAAAGSYAFAAILWLLTGRQLRRAPQPSQP